MIKRASLSPPARGDGWKRFAACAANLERLARPLLASTHSWANKRCCVLSKPSNPLTKDNERSFSEQLKAFSALKRCMLTDVTETNCGTVGQEKMPFHE